jgi:hypothetical protein
LRVNFTTEGLRPPVLDCTGEGVHNDTDSAEAKPYDGYMISTILIVLLILWVLGLATSYTLGGLIHILLVVAIIVVLLRIINGQNPLRG